MLNWYNTGVTVELRELIKSGVDIWDFEYPVPRKVINYNGKICKVYFDKKTFEKKVIDHFYFRQIGQETTGRFLHMFRTRVREIMPYYVQLYEFEAKFRNIDDPLESYNLIEEFNQTSSGQGSNSSEVSGTGNNTRKFSDTPQGDIANLNHYLTEATQDNSEASEHGSGTSKTSGNLSHKLTRKGNIGVQPLGSEVRDIRAAFQNIDMQVINELEDLFLKLY
jgi:hypothetical protein